MSALIQMGDQVKLLSVPEWLLRDLPRDEQTEILGFVGKTATVTEIDEAGYYWVGFGTASESIGGDARFSGHSFEVTSENLEKQS